MENKKAKILVAMSGGVDSSVAATLLVREGYDVTGAFMVNYNDANDNANQLISTNATNIGECWVPDYRDALRVAAKIGIPLIKLDFVKEYKEMVLDYMYKEYEAGRTPNPDVMCNKFVKFGVWLDKTKELGFDKLATGHYARLGREILNFKSQNTNKLQMTNYKLMCAKDKNKDQTYFLHQLSQKQLKDVLFPIGDYIKDEVRNLARKFDLPVAEKEESMGICFVGEVDMKEFLKNKIKVKPGNIVMSGKGEILGKHEGLAFYTIGQRHLKINNEQITNNKRNEPLYVIDKKFETNELVVGFEDDPTLFKKEILVKDVNWISGQAPKFPLKCKVRLRHRQPLQKVKIIASDKGELIVKFKEPQRAVTPGQFAVFYKNKECFGGGVIIV